MNRRDLAERLEGIFVPMFTPFTADGSAINEACLGANVDYLVSQGIRLLNPAGTTGEFWTLAPKEHHRVLRLVTQGAHALHPETIVIAGVSSPNPQQTIQLARFAVECGADVLQITPPFYLPCSDDDLVAYYRTISEAVDAPILLYEIPVATGVTLRGNVLERICEECPNAVALKTAAAATAPREFERLIRDFGERLRIFSGTGAYYSTFTYMSGVHGITDTLSNVAPQFGLTLHRLARAKRWAEMNEVYQGAFDVLEIEFLHGKAGLKEIANVCGFEVGPCRHPLARSLSPAAREDIHRRLSNWSFTQDLVERVSTSPADMAAAD